MGMEAAGIDGNICCPDWTNLWIFDKNLIKSNKKSEEGKGERRALRSPQLCRTISFMNYGGRIERPV